MTDRMVHDKGGRVAHDGKAGVLGNVPIQVGAIQLLLLQLAAALPTSGSWLPMKMALLTIALRDEREEWQADAPHPGRSPWSLLDPVQHTMLVGIGSITSTKVAEHPVAGRTLCVREEPTEHWGTL